MATGGKFTAHPVAIDPEIRRDGVVRLHGRPQPLNNLVDYGVTGCERKVTLAVIGLVGAYASHDPRFHRDEEHIAPFLSCR